jgi:hypothetical protein
MAYPRDTSLKSQFPQLDTKEMHHLMECMSICKACAKKCTEEGLARVACLCLDCSDICNLAIQLKSSDSEYAQQVLTLCSQVCRQCATACSHNTQSFYCQECAEACRHCAETCSAGSRY